jgi:hypothetical protein
MQAAVGEVFMCQKRNRKNDFPTETWRAHLHNEVQDDDERELKELLRELDQDNAFIAAGMVSRGWLSLFK